MESSFEPGQMVLFHLMTGCAGWIVGLVLLGVGFGPVRKAHPVAGYLLGAAGGMQFISSCCSEWRGPASVWADIDAANGMLGDISGLLSFFAYGAMFGLVIASAVVLAKKVSADAKEGAPVPTPEGQPPGGPS